MSVFFNRRTLILTTAHARMMTHSVNLQ